MLQNKQIPTINDAVKIRLPTMVKTIFFENIPAGIKLHPKLSPNKIGYKPTYL